MHSGRKLRYQTIRKLIGIRNMKFFSPMAVPPYHTNTLFSANDLIAAASQLFSVENIVGRNCSPEMPMESNLLMVMYLSLKSKLPKETKKTFPGSPKKGEQGEALRVNIFSLHPFLGS